MHSDMSSCYKWTVLGLGSVFYRATSYASAGLDAVILSVCLSLCHVRAL